MSEEKKYNPKWDDPFISGETMSKLEKAIREGQLKKDQPIAPKNNDHEDDGA